MRYISKSHIGEKFLFAHESFQYKVSKTVARINKFPQSIQFQTMTKATKNSQSQVFKRVFWYDSVFPSAFLGNMCNYSFVSRGWLKE